MNILRFQRDYYYKLSSQRRKDFRKFMCKKLDISDAGLYRRMRLGCFTTLEWNQITEYMSYNPL